MVISTSGETDTVYARFYLACFMPHLLQLCQSNSQVYDPLADWLMGLFLLHVSPSILQAACTQGSFTSIECFSSTYAFYES